MKKNIMPLLVAILLLHNAYSQNKPISADEQYFRNHIKELASDEFGGRKPLTESEVKTINYIADEFSALGLTPVNNGSYFQAVPLIDVVTKTENNQIQIKAANGSCELAAQTDFVIWSPQTEDVIEVDNSQFVFVGFGINAPEYAWNDYEGIDVKGKIVLALVNDPGYYDSNLFEGEKMTYYGRWIYKFEEAARQGALGVLVVHDAKPASYGWDVVQNSWQGHNLEVLSDNQKTEQVQFKGWITGSKAKEILELSGENYDKMFEKAHTKESKSIQLDAFASVKLINEVKEGNSYNVAGILLGTDLKDEFIVYSAHWDHLGIGESVDGDSIYNGAIDNASGVAGLLTTAKRFVEQRVPPRRSILFLSVTAEEAVLLGSQYYVDNPLVPLEKTAVNINFESIAPRPKTYNVFLYTPGYTDADKAVCSAAAAQGRNIVDAYFNTSGGYYRSDHFSFVKAGIPTIIAKGGNDYVYKQSTTTHAKNYHKPSDEYDENWDVTGTMDDLYLNYAVGYLIANDDKMPEWDEKSPYQRKK